MQTHHLPASSHDGYSDSDLEMKDIEEKEEKEDKEDTRKEIEGENNSPDQNQNEDKSDDEKKLKLVIQEKYSDTSMNYGQEVEDDDIFQNDVDRNRPKNSMKTLASESGEDTSDSEDKNGENTRR